MVIDGTPALFRPFTVGHGLNLQHRVVHAPLTRLRTNESSVPLPIMKEYYAQRASTPGTLIIGEASIVHPSQHGVPHASSFNSEEDIQAWKEIVNAVHAKGSYIFLQLVACGRGAQPSLLPRNPETGERYPYIAPSSVPLSDRPKTDPAPRELTLSEIQQIKEYFVIAARNAIERAGFDGVEVHGAHGYLVDEFLQDLSNQRTDEYGGSVENRSRFALEIVDEIVKVVGEERTAVRISPWSTYLDMGMGEPKPTFSYLATELKRRHPKLAYLHVVEPRIASDHDSDSAAPESSSNDFLREIWAPKVFISAGGYTREKALDVSEKHENELIAVGRYFTSNPDLPIRMMKNLPCTPYSRSTFYVPGDNSGKGYTDYAFAQA
ncbi:nadh:flavin oxidoreductase nadh oxidase [Moniliophthora roreri MCA 2997]|uniref:Nadh:flavin oxidoreductase nadh oxidase n=1 Tax=Moniliophthora roreri (strain MCA 2997) TaxID=1381753 RepID=V2X3K0_MONRO|nr:nadh:flavin oxidoreductase nadh oxidase [Moniliophthora roreri MCA 2997]